MYLASTAIIAFLIWFVRDRDNGFIEYLVPRELYLHPSTRVDFKVALFNSIFTTTGIFSALYLVPIVTHDVLTYLTYLAGAAATEPTTWTRGFIVAVILFFTQDFCRYLNHYVHHKNRVLWPFHALHHSAEVLTPITFMRAHPLYYVIQGLIISVLIGLIQALALFLIVGSIEIWVIYVTTLAFNAYIFLGAHLRHSHIPLRYGYVLEHILISPTQHQIHHSTDTKHFNKNLGEIFAIWDWMFGTLYIPDGNEVLVYGIADADGGRIEQPYPTLKAALVQPFRESAQAIGEIFYKSPQK
jgi:sterol desaturase/sphingolipid hydroxylase (fatty acid hydroxylase superfamily)